MAVSLKVKKLLRRRGAEETLKKVDVRTWLEEDIKRIHGTIPPDSNIVDEYQAGYNKMANVKIVYVPSSYEYMYIVNEPEYSDTVRKLYTLVRERLQTMEFELPEKLEERGSR